MKLPAYVNFDSRPYDADLYRATLDEEEIDGKTDPVAARSRMIGVRNTMRWRWVTGPDGEPVTYEHRVIAPS
jgi:RNA polymerase-associated protein LEO1